ncbi:MAG: hypothetical protein FK730_15795 [Asgard group archaeon]|nr:hypothetical protein [Asgard group archaeon]
MKISGLCSKCGSSRVVGPLPIDKRVVTNIISVERNTHFSNYLLKFDIYTCADCGYIERFIDEKGKTYLSGIIDGEMKKKKE